MKQNMTTARLLLGLVMLLQLQHAPAFRSIFPSSSPTSFAAAAAAAAAPPGRDSPRCYVATRPGEDVLGMAASVGVASATGGRPVNVVGVDPVVICGPSGVGKNTLIEALLEEYGSEQIEFAVSHTTRPPRRGEREGIEYHFVESLEAMRGAIDRGEFIEHAEVHGNIYGTSRAAVQSVLQAGKICILDIDVQGVRTLQARQARLGLKPKYVFIAPPSVETLRARLAKRATESEAQISSRVTTAAAEVAWATQNAQNFDSVLVNDDLSTARASIVALMKHYYPHLRSSKNPELADAMPTVSNTWRFPSLPRLLTAPWTKSVGEVPHQ